MRMIGLKFIDMKLGRRKKKKNYKKGFLHGDELMKKQCLVMGKVQIHKS